jgi:hypothetical protein
VCGELRQKPTKSKRCAIHGDAAYYDSHFSTSQKLLAWNWNGYFGSSFLLHMRVTTFLWNKKKHYEKFQQEKVDDASRMFLLCSFYKSAETTFFSEHKVDDASRM